MLNITIKFYTNNMVKKDSIALHDFLHSFTRNEMVVAIDKICSECYVPRQTVHNWQKGLARIPELYKRKIEEIFEKQIFSQLTKS